MCQLIGSTNDGKVPGLGSMLKYTNGDSFRKDEPATNEHHHHIITNNTTKKHITYTT